MADLRSAHVNAFSKSSATLVDLGETVPEIRHIGHWIGGFSKINKSGGKFLSSPAEKADRHDRVSAMSINAAELTTGRTFGLTFSDGADFFAELSTFCAEHDIKQGYIPMFLGAFRYAKVVGTCHRHEPDVLMLDSFIELEHVEVHGTGTLAYDYEADALLPHVHLSLGKRLHGAVGSTTHLHEAEVQFLNEMILVEVTQPAMTRPLNPDLGVGVLAFENLTR